ncbi:hypothetical protein SAMN05421821_101341 [Mucilaginibacter lappiensis]|uniref:Uncharacterized protein n=1 Tax=Mucilaginibacter lappiensis TaxID=354630 RepID=A0ABR6PDP7_9SPHI|nr:hypothetical protein [Mucilaginibacter lappiensis]MBB6107743.1 hypothetical protein [Mucilaginibacter lappiensis]SIP98500.1 hypothetical protein SAMN05421821_101341 [Mucilaginibacter lappiensis]
MKIIDLNGKEITVTDLELAILQADDYRHYQHVDPSFSVLDEGLKAYWEDVYQKLIRLRDG